MRNRTTALIARLPALAVILAAAFTLASCSSKKRPPPPPPPPPVTVNSVGVAAQAGAFASATEVAKGAVVRFNATANMSDNTTNDVTLTAGWVSSDPTILAFDIPSVPGVARAKKEGGPVTVTATETGGTAGTLMYTVVAPVPETLAISPAQLPDGVPVGQEGNFTATYTLTDKSTGDATMIVDWSSSAGGIVVVGNDAGNKGKAIALAPGKSDIRASKGTLSSQPVEVIVFAPVAPPQFVVEPAAPKQLPLGRTQQFRALLKYSTEQVVDVTERVVWQSSAENLAQFPVDFPKGLLLASPTQTGAVTITAQDPTSTTQTAPVTINVSNVAINSVVITPVGTADKSLPVGAGRQLGVIATYADSVARDITQTVDWTTTGTYLSVTNNTGSKGLVKTNLERPVGEAVGTVVITDPISTQSVNVAIDTAGRTLVRIEIAPADKKLLPKGYTQQFRASAVYSDSTVDSIDQVVWQSSAGDKVAISNTGSDKGKATALNEGLSNINAAVIVDGNKFVSNTVAVEVTPAALRTIAINPTTAVELSVGGTTRLTAVGTFSDTSTRDVTSLVNWRSTDTGVVSVASSGPSAGTIRGEAVGVVPTTVVATEPRTGVAGQKQISVTAKAENSIDIAPAGVTSRPVGVPFRYDADLIFTDASVEPVSEIVSWTSSNPAVAAISNEPGTKGKIFGKAVGSVTVTARGGGLTSAPVTFTVLAGVLQSIAITPSVPQAKNVGDTAQFTAQGSYSDLTNQDITKTVVWNSDSPGVAVITSTAPNEGALAAVGSGLANITASKEGVTSPGTSVVVAAQANIRTVAEITNGCCAGREVTMQGTAISWNGGEDYTFQDGSGPSIQLEWESSPPIPLNQEVRVTGLVESSGLEVDVTSWTPL